MFVFIPFTGIKAQTNPNKDYASSPYWIAMMKDTNTNYFEAVKAFNAYWKNREKPSSENEKFEHVGKGVETKSKNVPYSFEYRKFRNWQMRVKSYVQADGKILYPYQQLQIRKNSRNANIINSGK